MAIEREGLVEGFLWVRFLSKKRKEKQGEERFGAWVVRTSPASERKREGPVVLPIERKRMRNEV